MRIALTGASGFIGRRLLAQLRQNPGLDVVCLSRRAVGGAEWLPWSLDAAAAQSRDALTGVQAVCHLAAYLPPDMGDLSQAERCWRLNALATSELLQAARAAGVGHFLLCSSANILARQGDFAVTEGGPLGCEHAPAYLGSKAMGEIFANAARSPDFHVAVLRPSSVYGPGMPERGAIWHFTQRLMAGQTVQIENPRYRADFVWVDDVVEAILSALRKHYDGTVNIGSGTATGLTDLARELCNQLRRPESLMLQGPVRLDASPGFPALNISKAYRELDYRPTTFASGLALWLASRQ